MKSFGYYNFIRSSEHTIDINQGGGLHLSGDEARKIYLEEFLNANLTQSYSKRNDVSQKTQEKNTLEDNINDKDIFISVQNNDVITLTKALEKSPEKINLLDGYGWSLLMIACQANSVDIVKELLKREADTSVRDKAGHSAQSLIIKSKNKRLAEVFLNYSHQKSNRITYEKNQIKSNKSDESFVCDICYRQTFPDQKRHLSSTIHNINLSKHNKYKTWYGIPESNKGYQIMIKKGWNQSDGLGPDGSGKKYPIKTVQKLNRKGLGHKIEEHHKADKCIQPLKHKLKFHEREHNKKKTMEINFRREFY